MRMDIDFAALAERLTEEDAAKLAMALLELEKDADRQKWQNLFPDEGPLRRELYPKHMDFFAAGALYRERLFMAGNRCITPWTYIETPDGSAQSAVLLTSEAPRVQAWDGVSRCDAPIVGGFLKGLEPAFRLVTDNGQFFDCTRKHQLLTTEGWLSLDQIMSRANGLRSWHITQDYLASCAEGGYLDGQPPLWLSDNGQAPLPSPGDAQERGRLFFSPLDVVVHKFQYSRACLPHDHLSTRDDLRRLSVLFAPFAVASSSRHVLSLSESIQAYLQLAAGLALLGQEDAQSQLDQWQAAYHVASVTACGAAYTPEQYMELSLTEERSPSHTTLHSIGGLSLHDGPRTAIFYPFSHPELVGGNRIVACVPLGFQPIIDAHVPQHNNYFSAGVVHHNCGKSVAGAYELTCHLTGNYPDWWVGRRFDKPIDAWVAGDTNETTRDIIQKQLLGEVAYIGVNKAFDGIGTIPYDCHGKPKFKPNTGDLLDHIEIKHRPTGKWSRLAFKSYDQGRRVFQGTAKHVIWLDEECPADVYGECLIRTATTDGIVMLTFTPLLGMSEVVRSFLTPDTGEEEYA